MDEWVTCERKIRSAACFIRASSRRHRLLPESQVEEARRYYGTVSRCFITQASFVQSNRSQSVHHGIPRLRGQQPGKDYYCQLYSDIESGRGFPPGQFMSMPCVWYHHTPDFKFVCRH